MPSKVLSVRSQQIGGFGRGKWQDNYEHGVDKPCPPFSPSLDDANSSLSSLNRECSMSMGGSSGRLFLENSPRTFLVVPDPGSKRGKLQSTY